eukprot:811230_1
MSHVFQSHIDCTTAKSCTLYCTGELSCNGITVTCPSNGICNIDCESRSHSNTCQDIKIKANKNTSTNINCSDKKACEGGNIHCDHSLECNIACWGEEACNRMEIHAQNSTSLNISDCTGGSETCNHLKVYC